jgi:hypothetical protein
MYFMLQITINASVRGVFYTPRYNEREITMATCYPHRYSGPLFLLDPYCGTTLKNRNPYGLRFMVESFYNKAAKLFGLPYSL